MKHASPKAWAEACERSAVRSQERRYREPVAIWRWAIFTALVGLALVLGLTAMFGALTLFAALALLLAASAVGVVR